MVASRAVAILPALPFDVDITGANGPVAVGLSPCHIRRNVYNRPVSGTYDRPVRTYLEWSPQAELVRVLADFGPKRATQRWIRGRINCLSRKSRGRLQKLLAKVSFKGLTRRALFVTLTYPESWPAESAEYKRHLDLFWRRLRYGWDDTDRQGRAVHRSFPDASCIWRLEYQERGAPHYHLIVFGVGFIPHWWIDKAWSDVVGSGDERHERAGTQVAWPEKWHESRNYVAKYIAKQEHGKLAPSADSGEAERLDAEATNMGRHWGVKGRKNLPADSDLIEVPYDVFEQIKELLINERADDKGDDWRGAPFRGLWGTCGPGPVRPLLDRAGIDAGGGHAD